MDKSIFPFFFYGNTQPTEKLQVMFQTCFKMYVKMAAL